MGLAVSFCCSSSWVNAFINNDNNAKLGPPRPSSLPRLSMAADPQAKTKESTWDRITGPKLFKTVTNWQGIHSVPLVPLRFLTGVLMIHHGSEGGFWPANFDTPG